MTSHRATVAAKHHPVRSGIVARLVGSPGRLVRTTRGILGRNLSIRWKLTIWYGLMYAVTLTAIGFSLPRLLQWQTNRAIDSSLHATAGGIVGRLEGSHLLAGPYSSTCRGPAASYCSQIGAVLDYYSSRITRPGQFENVFILDRPRTGQSTIIQPTGTRAKVYDPEIGLYISDVVSSGRAQFRTISSGGETVRIYLTPVRVPAELARTGVLAVLEVLQIEADYSETRNALVLVLLILTPIAVAIALVLGWWTARAALRPIDRISRTVQGIGSSRDLSRRLNFVGPHDEVGRLAETFDDMMSRLEGVFETQKRFVADASHELRTPLTAIRGNADLIRIAPPEEREDCLVAIRRESERMSRLVNDLLLLAEADLAQQPVHKTRVDLNALLEEVLRSAHLLADGKVTVLMEPSDPTVADLDPDRVRQLLLNLVDNAVKFTPQGGVVSLRVCHRSGWAEIEVSDTGVGIPREQQDAIFRRFYRVDASRSTRGSGLGLAISTWIVESHGGTIAVSSQPGQGTTFTVRLPLSESNLSSQPSEYSSASSL